MNTMSTTHTITGEVVPFEGDPSDIPEWADKQWTVRLAYQGRARGLAHDVSG